MSIFTKVGSSIGDFLTSNGLNTALKIAELIPITAAPAMALETIKNAVMGTPSQPNAEFTNLSPALQAQFLEMYNAESARLKQESDAEAEAEAKVFEDRANARAREIAIAQTPKKDWLMWVTGLSGLGAFVFIVYASIYVTFPEKNASIVNILIGNVMGVALTIFTYFFGSSSSSKAKDETIKSMSK